jgi:predicted SprT family Zn-dependent metalloprotease
MSPLLQSRIDTKIDNCLTLCEQHFNRKFDKPTFGLFDSTRNAGFAYPQRWHVELSRNFLLDPVNQEEVINVTLPHEVAHLITSAVYPQIRTSGTKQEVHGSNWRHVMQLFGLPGDRCHRMELSGDRAITSRTKAIHPWQCTKCNSTVMLTTTRVNQIRSGHLIWHTSCGRDGSLVERLNTGEQPVEHGPRVIVPTESKIAICKRLFAQHPNKSRADMIKLFVQLASCTPAGAATYYQNCKVNK